MGYRRALAGLREGLPSPRVCSKLSGPQRPTAEVSLYVAPEAQGEGVGTGLLEEMIRRCPEFGVTTLVGFVFAHNEPSVKMNRKLGFEQWGYLPEIAELDGQQRDLMIVGKKIG